MPEKISITVHERLDEAGFVVKVAVEGGRVVRYPVMSREDAEGLARSINQFVQDGYPIDLLLPKEAAT